MSGHHKHAQAPTPGGSLHRTSPASACVSQCVCVLFWNGWASSPCRAAGQPSCQGLVLVGARASSCPGCVLCVLVTALLSVISQHNECVCGLGVVAEEGSYQPDNAVLADCCKCCVTAGAAAILSGHCAARHRGLLPLAGDGLFYAVAAAEWFQQCHIQHAGGNIWGRSGNGEDAQHDTVHTHSRHGFPYCASLQHAMTAMMAMYLRTASASIYLHTSPPCY